MGWLTKVAASIVGLASLGLGSWLIAAICFGYLAVVFWPKKRHAREGKSRSPIPPRLVLGGALALLTILAVSSGGTFSPMVFGASAIVVFFWPRISHLVRLSRTIAEADSILLRSPYSPFAWHAVAEVKPGSEEFPKSLSSFSGRLLILAGSGKVYAPVSVRASSRSSAEAAALSLFRTEAATVSRAGAYLLPLEAASFSATFPSALTATKAELTDAARSADIISLECEKGFVKSYGAYHIANKEEKGVSLPAADRKLKSQSLTWEVLSMIGKRVKWPQPDAYSNLLHALSSTKGVPLSERLESFEDFGQAVKVSALGGDKLELPRAQLRAVVATYA